MSPEYLPETAQHCMTSVFILCSRTDSIKHNASGKNNSTQATNSFN